MTDNLENHGYTPREQQASQIAGFAGVVMDFHNALLDEGATQDQALDLTNTWIAAVAGRGGAAND